MFKRILNIIRLSFRNAKLKFKIKVLEFKQGEVSFRQRLALFNCSITLTYHRLPSMKDVQEQVELGEKIRAIKFYRQIHGTALRESKEAVDLMWHKTHCKLGQVTEYGGTGQCAVCNDALRNACGTDYHYEKGIIRPLRFW